jgi:CheY-like chemotaxis protein
MDASANWPGKLVFVVDDEANIADTISLILSMEGFTVRTFYDGSAALEHAQRETPDIVLSDIIMPKMDGITLASKLQEQFPDCRILLISGNAFVSDAVPGGAKVEILAKPIPPEILIEKIKVLAAA